jgi:hypothetical protein
MSTQQSASSHRLTSSLAPVANAAPSRLLKETQIGLTQLAHLHEVHPSTVHRWCSRGAGGVRLETAKVGGRRITSLEAFQRWVDQRSGTDGSPTAPIAGSQRQADAQARAAAYLTREGV